MLKKTRARQKLSGENKFYAETIIVIGKERSQYRTGLNSKYKWEFIAKKQGGGQGVENDEGETSGIRRVLAKMTYQALAESRQGDQIPRVGDEEFNQITKGDQILRMGTLAKLT